MIAVLLAWLISWRFSLTPSFKGYPMEKPRLFLGQTTSLRIPSF